MGINDTKSGQPTDTLLIVDREQIMCELLQYRFENEGFRVCLEHDGHSACKRDLASYSLILVDLMDTDFTGLQFTRFVKSDIGTYHIPVIILSAKASEDDIVNGLDAGADDYIPKPFSTRELVARVKSVLRRRRITAGRRMDNFMRFRDLEVDLGAGTVRINGTQVSLTRTEFLILALFMRHRNQFFARAEILDQAWEGESVSERTVDTGISRLRKKIGEYGRHIINRQGFGYGFVE